MKRKNYEGNSDYEELANRIVKIEMETKRLNQEKEELEMKLQTNQKENKNIMNLIQVKEEDKNCEKMLLMSSKPTNTQSFGKKLSVACQILDQKD